MGVGGKKDGSGAEDWWWTDRRRRVLFYTTPGQLTTHLLNMHLCRVLGAVVSSRKEERLRESRLLLVARIGLDGQPTGAAEEIALDPGVDAGTGDVVLVAKEGAVVSDLFDQRLEAGGLPMPANVVIVAVVDDWAPKM